MIERLSYKARSAVCGVVIVAIWGSSIAGAGAHSYSEGLFFHAGSILDPNYREGAFQLPKPNCQDIASKIDVPGLEGATGTCKLSMQDFYFASSFDPDTKRVNLSNEDLLTIIGNKHRGGLSYTLAGGF